MSNGGRAFTTLLFLWFLWLALGEINNVLAHFSIHLNADVLFVVFAALYLRLLHAWWIIVVVGLSLDAVRMLPYGMSTLGLIAIWVCIVWLRQRIIRERWIQVGVIAAIPQVIWLCVLTLTFAEGRYFNPAFLQRFLIDTILSFAFVLIFAFPWCELQRAYIRWSGWDLNAETHRV